MLCIPFPIVSFSFIRFDAVAGSLPPSISSAAMAEKRNQVKKIHLKTHTLDVWKEKKISASGNGSRNTTRLSGV
jgi:hypothetical protein